MPIVLYMTGYKPKINAVLTVLILSLKFGKWELWMTFALLETKTNCQQIKRSLKYDFSVYNGGFTLSNKVHYNDVNALIKYFLQCEHI